MKRPSYKTMSLEGLERIENYSSSNGAVYTWKYETYKLSESDTEKCLSTTYLRVNYDKLPSGKWQEGSRYKFYRRQTKYLAINGVLRGGYILRDTPGYKLFYTQYGTGDSNLPRRVMIDVEDMARRLGLLW